MALKVGKSNEARNSTEHYRSCSYSDLNMTSLSARNVTIGLIAAITAIGLKDVVYNKFFRKRAAPALTQAEARAIMRGLVEQLGPTVRACADLAKTVQQELATGWGPLPTEAEMMATYVYPTFKAELVKIQDTLCAEHNVCEWELEEAVEVYGQEDAELASLAGDLAKLMTKFGAPAPGGGKLRMAALLAAGHLVVARVV